LVEGADLAQVAEILSTADDFDGAVSSASELVRKAKADAFAHVPDLRRAEAPDLAAGRPKDRARRLAALFRDAARGVHHHREARLIEQVLREEPVPPKKANPRLPTDLATIVEKATRKDPKLRYDTADALAQDLDAFLEGRPIAARPPTLGYLFKLAIRKHK